MAPLPLTAAPAAAVARAARDPPATPARAVTRSAAPGRLQVQGSRVRALGRRAAGAGRALRLRCRAEAEDTATVPGTDGRLGSSWSDMSRDLKAFRAEGKLTAIKPADADKKWRPKLAGGEEWVFVDVQTEDDFNKVHAIGCVNIPLFVPITGNSFLQIQRKIGFAMNGNMNGTEENPNLVEEFEVQCDMDKTTPLMLICGVGGSLEGSEGSATGERHGMRSRSLIVAHRLLKAGFTNVHYVDGGIKIWFREQFPTNLTHDEF